MQNNIIKYTFGQLVDTCYSIIYHPMGCQLTSVLGVGLLELGPGRGFTVAEPLARHGAVVTSASTAPAAATQPRSELLPPLRVRHERKQVQPVHLALSVDKTKTMFVLVTRAGRALE